MRPGFDQRGKFIPPASLASAVKRHQQLGYEAVRITEQLADELRREQYTQRGDAAEYDDWRRRAESALRIFRREERLLGEWIATRRDDVEDLLRRAYEMLQTLEQDDLDEGEVALMERLDAHFQVKAEQKATG
jgi:hypothetical protein